MSTIRKALLAGLVLLAALPAVAAAGPVPGIGQAWPMCADDDDGRYCVESWTRNGVAIAPSPDGHWYEPYVDLIGDGQVRFGVQAHCPTPSGWCPGNEIGDVSPDDVYEIHANTGAIATRELWGHVQDVTFATGGSDVTGHTMTLVFRPVPVAWRFLTPPYCGVGSCPDDLVATLLYDGFVTGYATDLTDFPWIRPAERALRTGFVHAYSAENADQPRYDADTNSLVFALANPHWRTRGPDVVATGSYETFLPNAMLVGLLHVPDPASLTSGSLVVSRSAGAATSVVPVALEHTAGGIQVRITGITFSSPTFRIRVRRTPPGAPRAVRATRIGPHAMRVAFRVPLANGGRPVLRYVVRCNAPHRSRTATGARSPIVVRKLVKGVRYRCSARAVNAIGKGPFSTPTRAA